MAKMIKPTAKTEFARVELLKKRLAEGFPGVTQDMLERAQASAKSLLAIEMKSSVERFMGKYGAEDWYKAARAMYNIVPENMGFKVTSEAKDWVNAREWHCDSTWEAEDKINTLILYKQHDRKRGFGDMEKDVERMQHKLAEMEKNQVQIVEVA